MGKCVTCKMLIRKDNDTFHCFEDIEGYDDVPKIFTKTQIIIENPCGFHQLNDFERFCEEIDKDNLQGLEYFKVLIGKLAICNVIDTDRYLKLMDRIDSIEWSMS